jgi:hypothetical protein
MIAVERLVIKEFRGIRELDLSLKSKSFAVCGPNGTGKSGIVDALEFVLTGTISRLTGRGRGDLSIAKHAPHVDSSKNPEKSIVEAYLAIPGLQLKGPVHIIRSVKSPKVVKCSPDTPQIRSALARLENHPEIALSRREIIKYILAEPGRRAEDVQELLKLDSLRTIRANLQRIANASDKDAENAKKAAADAGQDLSRTLNLPILNTGALLGAVNGHRKTLGLEPLEVLTATTSIRDGLATGSPTTPSLIAKKQTTEEITTCGEAAVGLSKAAAQGERDSAAKALKVLKADEALLDGVKRAQLLALALDLYDEERCSVCDTEFEPEAFQAIIQSKQEKLRAVAAKRKEAEQLLTPVVDRIRSVARALSAAAAYGPKLKPAVTAKTMQDWGRDLTARATQLEQFLPLDKALEVLEGAFDIPKETSTALDGIAKAIAALPEPSLQQQAFDALTIGQAKLDTYRATRLTLAAAEMRAKTARKVFDVYSTSTETALEAIYKKVEADFSNYYRILNDDDESTFAAQLTPSMGKLGFGVDFYKRGFFPPGAYHSEGHQDSMGLCLYLALMKHLQGDGFTFAVLDDVLMSVDANHRRKVCELLKTKFSNTQFVLTTHDRVWLKHMGTAGLVDGKSMIHFRKWDVDHGPSPWGTGDVWTEIAQHLDNNDIKLAASSLRHYLEHLGAEMCQALRAPVEYRGDGQHDPAELLEPATAEFRKLLKRAKDAAASWGSKTQFATLEALEKDYSAAVKATKMDQWQVNAGVHFNPWANLEKKDFQPIVQAFQDLSNKLTCPTCKDLMSVRPIKGPRETLYCSCGAHNFTLASKTKAATAG